MEQKFIEIFTGFSDNYGQADMQRLEVDPISKKQKPEYRWAQSKITDEDYLDHLTFQAIYQEKVSQSLTLKKI